MLYRVYFSNQKSLSIERINNNGVYFDGKLHTDQKVFYNTNSCSSVKSTRTLLEQIENDVSGLIIGTLSINLFSAKFSKSRIFYTVFQESLYLSFDLRELLRYSSRKLNQKAAYSILKFGEIYEGETIIKDIYSIPCCHYIEINPSILSEIIKNGKARDDNYVNYFKVNYTYEGGSLSSTKLTLLNSLDSIREENPTFLISGGVDSSLLIHLFNETNDSPFECFFMHFKDSPGELASVKRSVLNTKAKLNIVEVEEKNLIDHFKKSISNLIYPVYDNGSAYVGYFMMNHLGLQNQFLIDGTLADSCYGVKNYNQDVPKGSKQSDAITRAKEWIYHNLLLMNSDGFLKNKPRDSYVKHEFIEDLLWNAGPEINFWFNKSRTFSHEIEHELFNYWNLFESSLEEDYWAKYTVIKMFFYAGKQTSVKTYDMKGTNQVCYPFMFNNVINDQGKYTWIEKSKNNIVKYPLKKILEEYIGKDFIYRKKVGLQSQTLHWITNPSYKNFFITLLSSPKGVANLMMRGDLKKLIHHYNKAVVPKSITKLVLSLSVIQLWMDINEICTEE